MKKCVIAKQMWMIAVLSPSRFPVLKQVTSHFAVMLFPLTCCYILLVVLLLTPSTHVGLSLPRFQRPPISQLSSTMFIFFHSDSPPHLFRLFIYFFPNQASVSSNLFSDSPSLRKLTPCKQLYSVTFAYLQNALLFCFVRTAVSKPYL